MTGHVIDLVCRPRFGADCIRRLGERGITGQPFAAVDGTAGDTGGVIVPPTLKRAFIPGEIGCFASHQQLAKDALSGTLTPVTSANPDWFLIFEDDAIPVGAMSAAVLARILAKARALGVDLVHLDPGNKGQRRRCRSVLRCMPPGRINIGSHAYLAHASAMARIVTWRMEHPIDIAIGRARQIRKAQLFGPATFIQRVPPGAPSISKSRGVRNPRLRPD